MALLTEPRKNCPTGPHMPSWHWWITWTQPIKLSVNWGFLRKKWFLITSPYATNADGNMWCDDGFLRMSFLFPLRPASALHEWNIALYDMLCQNVFSSLQWIQERWAPPKEFFTDIYIENNQFRWRLGARSPPQLMHARTHRFTHNLMVLWWWWRWRVI